MPSTHHLFTCREDQMAFATRLGLAVLLLIVTSQSLGQASASEGPCAQVGSKFKSGKAVVPSEFKACLKTFGFKRKQADSLIDTIWKVLVDFYPYINLSQQSPSKELSLQARVRRDLLKIKDKFATYKYDFDYHRDLYLLVESLNDGHTFWRPQCYLSAYSLSGLPVVQVYDSSTATVKIKVAPLRDLKVLAKYLKAFSFTKQRIVVDPLDLAGAEVLKIGGRPALDYADQAARTVGGYRDHQSRLNTLFLRPVYYSALGETSYGLGELQYSDWLPDNDTLSYTLRRVGSKKEETLNIPYFVTYSGSAFSTNGEYYAYNCEASDSFNGPSLLKASAPTRQFPMQPPPDQPSRRRPIVKFEGLENLKKKAQSGGEDDYYSDTFFPVHLLPNTATAVLVLPDFIGDDFFFSDDIFTQLYTVYLRLQKLNASRLVIDVSNNGGGYALAASYLTNLLFPGPDPQFRLQFKAPPLAREAVKVARKRHRAYRSDYSWLRYEDPATDDYMERNKFFNPLVNLTQVGVTDSFSSLFRLIYDPQQPGLSDDVKSPGPLPSKPLFAPKDILILSNGLCFSTCAVFTTQLNLLHGVRIITLGGKQTQGPFSYAAGLAGFVMSDYEYDFWFNNLYRLDLENLPSAPKPLPVRGGLGFPLAQAYLPNNTRTPAEFVYSPSQLHMKQTDKNVLSQLAQWTEAAKFFKP